MSVSHDLYLQTFTIYCKSWVTENTTNFRIVNLATHELLYIILSCAAHEIPFITLL